MVLRPTLNLAGHDNIVKVQIFFLQNGAVVNN